MSFTLAVLIQLFLFTEKIHPALLKFASLLIGFHVFLGTHFALGLFKLVRPLDWYPAQPLESAAGWLTLSIVVAALVWRNVKDGSHFPLSTKSYSNLRHDGLIYYKHIVGFVTAKDPNTVEGYLKFLDLVCKLIIGGTYFFKLLNGHKPLASVLTFILAIRYFFSRISVKQELEIGKTLFPSDKVPDSFQLGDRAKITFQVIGFMILYLVLSRVTDYIIVASIVIFCIACNDCLTRSVINNNINRVFGETKWMPEPGEIGSDAIMRRRDIAIWYIKLHHLPKEAGCALGCFLSCSIATYGYFYHKDFDAASYIILIITLVINEIITVWWRFKRYLWLSQPPSSSISA